MTAAPRIVVLTGCYNHGHYLPACIASVQASTVQDYVHVIVDDASTDDSLAVAMAAAALDPRIVVLRQPENRGLSAAQNLGITAVTAPWYLKADADDLTEPDYLERILAVADARKGVNVVLSPALVFGEAITPTVYRYPTYSPARVAEVLMIPGPAAFTRRLWEAVGGFDERLRLGEDWDFWVRAERAVGLTPVQLATPGWHYRQHDGPRVSRVGIARVDAVLAHLAQHQRHSGTLDWRTAPPPAPALTGYTHAEAIA